MPNDTIHKMTVVASNGPNLRKGTLQYLPVGLFGSTVAIAGLSIAWTQAAKIFSLPTGIGTFIGILAWLMYLLLVILYLLKIISYPDAVKKELLNSVTGNFLGTFFISTVLLGAVTISFSLTFGRIVWVCGAVGGAVFMYELTARLFKGQLNVVDTEPPALIPGLVLLNAVVAGQKMGFAWTKEANLILFSIGIVYVFVFFILILSRLIYNQPVTPFLVPTLLLMSAPSEVGMSAYVSQTLQIDMFSSVLFYFGLFTFIVILVHILKERIYFMTSWWSACFSIGALTNAALKYSFLTDGAIEKFIAGVLLVVATLFMAVTLFITVKMQLKNELLKP